MEAKWKVSVEHKAFNIGFEIWKDLGIYRWELIENSLGYIKMQKKKRHFIENMFKNLSTNKKQADTAPFYLRRLELVMQANLPYEFPKGKCFSNFPTKES